jgi:hypothetical protein
MDRGTTQELGPEAELASRIAAARARGVTPLPRPRSTAFSPRAFVSTGAGTCATTRAADDLMQQVMMMTIEKLRAGELREPSASPPSCSASAAW